MRGSAVISGFTDNAGNEAVLNKLMTSKFPLVVILTELAEQLKQGEFDMTLTWVPADQRRFRELQEGEKDGRRRWQLGFQDPSGNGQGGGKKRHKEMGKDEGSRRGDGKTKPSERLRMRDPW